MLTKRAIVDWIPSNKGGRQRPPLGVGVPAYATVVRFTDDPWPPVDAAWSLVIEKVEALSVENRWIANVHFLVKEAPHHSLREGRDFELYEGSKCVARGTIMGDTQARINIENTNGIETLPG